MSLQLYCGPSACGPSAVLWPFISSLNFSGILRPLDSELINSKGSPSYLIQKLQGSSAYICWFLDSSPHFHRNPLFSHHLRSLAIVTSVDSEAFLCLYTFLGRFSFIWTPWPYNLLLCTPWFSDHLYRTFGLQLATGEALSFNSPHVAMFASIISQPSEAEP